MSSTITLPLWLFAILLVLSAWAAFDRLLLPGVRWYLRRKIRGVLREIGTRLNIELPQFKLTRRQVLIDRLFHDARVQEAVEEEHAKGTSRLALLQRVDGYAREIVPSFNAYLYFRIGYWLAKSVAKALYRVRLGYADAPGLAAVNPKSSVVFVMNHRSNADYVLVAFLAAEHAALSYAVGEWARIWPLQQLIRAMGAYFVRRNSGDALYRVVLQRYVQMATEAGVPQAVFPEGGLSYDGKLRAPKLGLLDYMLKTFDPAGERDLVFIPVGINYDRVLEDRTLLARRDPSVAPSGRFRTLIGAMLFFAHNLWLLLTARWHRFGYACVNFGHPVSMRDYATEKNLDFRKLSEAARHHEVERVAQLVMTAIGRNIPALPVSLVATVFLRRRDTALSEIELKAAVFELVRALEASGAHVYVPRSDLDYAVGVGLRMLTLRHLVDEADGLYRANPKDIAVLEYYANAIAPLAAGAASIGLR